MLSFALLAIAPIPAYYSSDSQQWTLRLVAVTRILVVADVAASLEFR